MLIKISNDRIGDDIEAKTGNRGDQTPLKDVFLVSAVVDLCNMVSYKTNDIIYYRLYS